MTAIPVTCENCGAKYKLPADWHGKKAKCQKCGSAIDVAGQIAAAGSPAGAAASPANERPAAAAKPAVDRSKTAAKPARAAEPARAPAGRSRREARAGGDGHGDGDQQRRGDRGRKKNDTMPLLLAGIGLLVIVGVAAFFLVGNKRPPAESQTAAADPKPAAKAPAAPAAGGQAEAASRPAGPAPAEAAAPKPVTPPATEPPPAVPRQQEAAAPPAGEASDPGQPKQRWMRIRGAPTTMDQVVAAKERYGQVEWPVGIDAQRREEIRGLASDVADGGKPGIQAKPKLLAHGYAALFGIVERLRELDYRSADDSMVAFEFNKLLEQITGGLTASFEPVEANEDIHPAKAEWNTRTVKGWLDVLAKIPDEDTFRREKTARLQRQEK